MNQELILSFMKTPRELRCFASLDSTNTLAKQWARAGARHGSAVLADSQTGGKGRRGRSFASPPGGLYLSLIVDSDGAHPGQLTTLAAVAAVQAIKAASGQEIRIKWVNDLFYKGLKVGGILTEGVMVDGLLSRAVIGIGINLGPEAPRVAGAGTLYEQKRPLQKEELAAYIIDGILEGLPRVPGHLDQYRAHCLTLHQQVAFEQEGQPMTGLAREIDGEGALLVETSQGLIRLIAGDVSVRPEKLSGS